MLNHYEVKPLIVIHNSKEKNILLKPPEYKTPDNVKKKVMTFIISLLVLVVDFVLV